MQRVFSSAVVLALGLTALGCGKKDPHFLTAAAPSTAQPPASPHGMPGAGVQPNLQTPGTQPGGVAPPTSTATPTPPPPAQAGVGGLSVAPVQTLAAPTTTIVVGAGPVVGRTARGDVRQHLRDWEARDLRALDPLDVRLSGDGLTPSRELVAFYSRRQNGRLFLRVDLLDLRYGAELGGLDLVVLLGWGGPGSTRLPLGVREQTAVPYGAALVVRDTQDYSLLDASGVASVTSAQGGFDVSFRADLDAIELGLDERHLRALGWTGQALTFQVMTVKDNRGRVADAMLEIELRVDRTLNQVVREGWVAPRRSVLAPVVVGNRAALTASYLSGLVHSTTTTTREGFPTGMRRLLESHTAHGLPVNLHVSGVLANAIGWASSSLPASDGPAFLARLAQFFDGDKRNGEGDFLPGLYVDNMMPYFEGAANTRFIARAAEVYRTRLGITSPGRVFWVPERVMKGSTFTELRAAGFTHTVLDRTHLKGWFNKDVTDGKLHRVNGVDCFVIDPTVNLFAQEDGGPSLALRRLLIQRALDPDAQQAVVTVADWEEYAGRKGNPDVPDVYDRVLTWISQCPWIEVAGLQDLAGRGWSAVDHGTNAALPTETYEWLRHATEENYDHWYYGHPLEESLSALQPMIRQGRPHARRIGDVRSPGTLFGDTWAAIGAAPRGKLKDLAEVAFASVLYRTAWHREDMHDTRRFTNGTYVSPDTTYDTLSGFSFSLATRAGEAAIVARAARWAAQPPTAAGTAREDVDLDGEQEYLLFDARLFLVFEQDGGRLVAGFVREPSATGSDAYQVFGDPLAFPSAGREIGLEDDVIGAARNSVLKDVWLTGPAKSYVNDTAVASIATTGVALRFVSSDGKLTKTISWRAAGEVEVRYALDPTAGTLYSRAGLSPHLAGLALSGQRDLVEADSGGVYTLAKTHGGKTVTIRIGYADSGHTARRNRQASDGTTASPRNTAFQHMIELEGDAPGFSFSLSASVR